MLTLVLDERPWSPGDAPSRVVNRWEDDGRVCAVAMTDGRQHWIDWTGLGVFRFDDRSNEVRFHRSPGLDATHATAFFACVVQPLILQSRGLPVLHASAAGSRDGAIVFCGLSGSGKSTIAYALGRRPGFSQIADDAVVLRESDHDEFVVVRLPYRSRLRSPAADFFHADPIRLSATEPDASHPLPLRAVVVLSQAGAEQIVDQSLLIRVAPPAAFSVLLAHAHCFDEADRTATSRMVQTYMAMADVIPIFRLTYRPDFRTIPALLSTILEAVSAPARRPAVG